MRKNYSGSVKTHLFNRFMMKTNHNFFALSKEEQDRYKVDHEEELEFPFKQFLHKELLGIEYKNEKFYSDLETEEDVTFEMNKLSTLLRGIGENYFSMNECFDTHEDMLTFKTLYDYDVNEHNYQEKVFMSHRAKKDQTELPKYRMRLNSRWARVFLDEKNEDGETENNFYYIILQSPAFHIYHDLEDIAYQYIEKLIPHDFVEGENHNKKVDGGFTWDYRLQANGLEDPLDDLNVANRLYLGKVYEKLRIEFDDNKHNKIWMIDKSSENDPSKFYICSDQDVLKNLRFSHWQEDTAKFMTDDLTVLSDIIEEEEDKLLRFLEKTKKEIIDKFDPKITKIKKGMDIVIAGKDLDF